MRPIAIALMIKNEEDWALKTLQSAERFADTFVVLDTGSTDGTIEQLEEWAAESHNLFVKRAPFVDFATSRNVLLDFCTEVVREPYLLLLDAGEYVEGNLDGLVGDGALINGRPRIIKTHSGWRFKGAAYEYLICGADLEPCTTLKIRRDPERKKPAERIQQDYMLLKREVQLNPENSRSTFYLGRTCELLGFFEEAAVYYQTRACQANPSSEELFWTFLGLGRCFVHMDLPAQAQDAFLRAYNMWARAEPLVELARQAIRKDMLRVAFLYLKQACDLEEIEDNICYQYYRWHYMGMIAYHVQELDIGINACKRALAFRDTESDRENLSFYLGLTPGSSG